MIKLLAASIRRMTGSDRSVSVMATMGSAAANIDGETVHADLLLSSRAALAGGAALKRLPEHMQGRVCSIIDECSMLGKRGLYWVEQRHRQGMHCGEQADRAWGGIPVVILLGDMAQLLPVLDEPLHTPVTAACRSESARGYDIYREFDHAIFLRDVVRQTSGSLLLPILQSIRFTPQKDPVGIFEWLKTRWLATLSAGGQDEFRCNAKYVMADRDSAKSVNAERIHALNTPSRGRSVPVARLQSLNGGSDTCSTYAAGLRNSKSDFGHLPSSLDICVGARVILTKNMCTDFKLVNGSCGIVRFIAFLPDDFPVPDGTVHPSCIWVDFPDYIGPAICASHPTLVPIGSETVRGGLHCRKRCSLRSCSRVMYPLRLAYASTIHKAQGITVGPGHLFERIVVNLGGVSVEKRHAGISFVALSRATHKQFLALDGELTLEHVEAIGSSPLALAVLAEDARIQTLHDATLSRMPWGSCESDIRRRYDDLLATIMR